MTKSNTLDTRLSSENDLIPQNNATFAKNMYSGETLISRDAHSETNPLYYRAKKQGLSFTPQISSDQFYTETPAIELMRTLGYGAEYVTAEADMFTGLDRLEWARDMGPLDTDCPMGCPKSLEAPPLDTCLEGKIRTDPFELLAQFYARLREGYVDDKELQHAFGFFLDKKPIVSVLDDDDKYTFFYGSRKGDNNYITRLGRRAAGAGLDILKKKGTKFLLTPTYDPKLVDWDLTKAPQGEADALTSFLKKCREFGDFSYVTVLEFTDSGIPHSHMICNFEGFKKSYFPHWELDKKCSPPKMRCVKRVKDRAFVNMLQEWYSGGFLDVEIVSNKGAVGYITKYFCKYLSLDKEKSLRDKEPLTSNDRKRMLGYVMPSLFHLRTIRISQGLGPPPAESPSLQRKHKIQRDTAAFLKAQLEARNIETQKALNERLTAMLGHVPYSATAVLAAGEKPEGLILLSPLNKSPPGSGTLLCENLNLCSGMQRLLSKKCPDDLKTALLTHATGPPDDLWPAIMEYTYLLGCQGCVLVLVALAERERGNPAFSHFSDVRGTKYEETPETAKMIRNNSPELSELEEGRCAVDTALGDDLAQKALDDWY